MAIRFQSDLFQGISDTGAFLGFDYTPNRSAIYLQGMTPKYGLGGRLGIEVTVAIPVPGAVNSENPAHRARFWLLTGRALVLPHSPTSLDYLTLHPKAYKHAFGQVLYFK